MKEIEQTMGDPTAKILGFDKLVEEIGRANV